MDRPASPEYYLGQNAVTLYLKNSKYVSYFLFLNENRDTLVICPPFKDDWNALHNAWSCRFLKATSDLGLDNDVIERVRLETKDVGFSRFYWKSILQARKQSDVKETYEIEGLDLLQVAGKSKATELKIELSSPKMRSVYLSGIDDVLSKSPKRLKQTHGRFEESVLQDEKQDDFSRRNVQCTGDDCDIERVQNSTLEYSAEHEAAAEHEATANHKGGQTKPNAKGARKVGRVLDLENLMKRTRDAENIHPQEEQSIDSTQTIQNIYPDKAQVSMNLELFDKVLGYSTQLVEAHQTISAMKSQIISAKEAENEALRQLVTAREESAKFAQSNGDIKLEFYKLRIRSTHHAVRAKMETVAIEAAKALGSVEDSSHVNISSTLREMFNYAQVRKTGRGFSIPEYREIHERLEEVANIHHLKLDKVISIGAGLYGQLCNAVHSQNPSDVLVEEAFPSQEEKAVVTVLLDCFKIPYQFENSSGTVTSGPIFLGKLKKS
ncbi:hypothetical protein BC937DRAFT_91187 [Endogone sp. FLAS-F59071]|nr:hypothetical protein BC937DRAFT_91187 [Endogone sp. FLAS-F59071]|eukprot:RUS16447.1 hypothetical protein BC937DRAFT_91187 [Endogone sp. FLAS-F59071]